MDSVLGLLVVVAALITIMWLAAGGIRPRGGPGRSGARKLSDLRRYGAPSDPAAYVRNGSLTGALIAALAGSGIWQLSEQFGFETISTSPLEWGFLLGLVCMLPIVGRVALSTLGVVGSLALTITFVASESCMGVPRWARLLGFVLVAVCFGAGWFFGAAFRGGARTQTVTASLALFVVLDVLRFLSSPLSVDLGAGGLPLVIAAPIVAGALGLVSGFAPRLILGLTALAVTAAELSAGLVFGTTCTGPSDPGVLAVALGFAVPFVAAALLRRATRSSTR